MLGGCVTNSLISPAPRSSKIVFTGAGPVEQRHPSSTDLYNDQFIREQEDSREKAIPEVWRTGGIFGYLDFLVERQRLFQAAATEDNTIVAKISRSHMDLMKSEDSELHALVQKALLHACTMDLANNFS